MQRHIGLDPGRYPLHPGIISAKENARLAAAAAVEGPMREPKAAAGEPAVLAVSVSKILSVGRISDSSPVPCSATASPDFGSDAEERLELYGEGGLLWEGGVPDFYLLEPERAPEVVDSDASFESAEPDRAPEAEELLEPVSGGGAPTVEELIGHLADDDIEIEEAPLGDELPAVFGFRVLSFPLFYESEDHFFLSLGDKFFLSEGTKLTIGPDISCDICDMSMPDMLFIFVKNNRVYLSGGPHDRKIMVSGLPVIGNECMELPFYKRIRIGDVKLITGPSVKTDGTNAGFDLVSSKASDSLAFVEAEDLVIGDDDSCDVRIDVIMECPNLRADVYLLNGKPYLHAQDSGIEVKLNGRVLPAVGSEELHDHDCITIDSSDIEFIYFAGDRREHADMRGRSTIIAVQWFDKIFHNVVDGVTVKPGMAGAIMFGRPSKDGTGNHKDGCLFVPVPGETVSREHALIRFDENNRPVIHDLGSRNGTLVNGKPLQCARVLNDGDVVMVGEALLRISSQEYGGEPSPPAEAPAWVRIFSRFDYLHKEVSIRKQLVSMESRIRSANIGNREGFMHEWEGRVSEELILISYLDPGERAKRFGEFRSRMEILVEKALAAESPENFMRLVKQSRDIAAMASFSEKAGRGFSCAAINPDEPLMAAVRGAKIHKKPEHERWPALLHSIPSDILGEDAKSGILKGIFSREGSGNALRELNRALVRSGLLVMEDCGSPVLAKATGWTHGSGMGAVFISKIDRMGDAFGIAKMGGWMFFESGGFLVVPDNGADPSFAYSYALQQHADSVLGLKSGVARQLTANAIACLHSSLTDEKIRRHLRRLAKDKDASAARAGSALLKKAGNGEVRGALAASVEEAYRNEFGVGYAEIFGEI